ncbi:PREDICTED: uncharacterized protein LOC106102607 isoform X1 [Papilio polytes]|uniref:uncharacterized protein LOC106102607 isoform X1 n=1 Tax=Papilio polytes TaxID=76194 RepID=UPI0006760160|nr:PREDICTED: uncharacterized protein LOC106102607 isoform X1 [Papilio polytes]
MSDLTEAALKESGSAVVCETLTANAQLPSPIQEPMDVKADKSSSVLAYGNVKTVEFGVQTDLTFPFHVPDEVQNVLNAYTVTAEETIEDTSFSETMLNDASRSEYLQPNQLFIYDLSSLPLAAEDLEITIEDTSFSETMLNDASRSEYLQPNQLFIYDLSSLPLAAEEQEITIEDTSFSETMLNDASRSEYLQPYLIYNPPSPPSADEDLEILYQPLSSSDELDPAVFQRDVQEYRILSPPLSDDESQLISPEDLGVMDIFMDKGETED